MNTEDDLFEALAKQQYGATKRKGGETEGPSRRRHAFMAMARPFLRVVVVVTTPHTDANSIQKDNHQLSTQFKKTKRGPAFRAK
jgi:hypothetical protein